MLSLIIDTSLERGLVALAHGEELIGEASMPFGLQNSHMLFRELDALFKTCAVDRKKLELIVCGTGPGSYTGMRVAAATAKAVSFALDIPLVGVSTLMGLIPQKEGHFAAISDAKISGVYLLKGIKEAGQIRYLTEPLVVSLKDLPEHLKGVATLVALAPESLRLKVSAAIQWEEARLSPQAMMHWALQKYEEGHIGLELLYLRKTQAEIEKGIKDPIAQ